MRTLLLALFLTFPFGAFASGPFGGSVTSLVLASDGRTPAWAATTRGLFQFSGARWSRCDPLQQRDLRAVATVGDRLLVVEAGGHVVGSDDGGQTWQPSGRGLKNRYGHRVEEVLSLSVAPGLDRVYLGSAGQGLFESVDGGRSWKLLLAGLEDEVPQAFHARAVLPARGDRPLLMGTDGRGLYSFREGAWVPVPGGLPPDLRAQALAESPADPQHLALATRGAGLWESRDAGATWRLLRKGRYGAVAALAIGRDGAVLAHFSSEGLALSRGKPAPRPQHLRDTGVLALVPRTGGGWLAGVASDGVLEISAEGAPAGFLNAGLDATSIRALRVGAQPGELWAGDTNGVFWSADGGVTWAARDEGFRGSPVNRLLWSGGALYVGFGGAGVYRWAPDQSAWEERTGNMGTANTIYGLAADVGGVRLYAGTEGGVLVTADGGGRWEPHNQGLPPASAWLVAASPAVAGQVWAAGGGSLFRSDNAGGAWRAVSDARPVDLGAAGTEAAEVVWLLEDRRLVTFGTDGVPRTAAEAPAGERFLCFAPAEGKVWLGTSKGLWLLAGSELSKVWNGAGVLALLPDGDGTLLAGTDGRGVVRFRLR